MVYQEKYEKDCSSDLVLKKMYIKKVSFERNEHVNINLDIKINHKIKKIDNNLFEIVIILVIVSTDSSLKIDVEMIGMFESKNEKLIQENAIAIMFPYIRSYVSTITTQPDLTPIVLQPINVLSLLDKNKV